MNLIKQHIGSHQGVGLLYPSLSELKAEPQNFQLLNVKEGGKTPLHIAARVCLLDIANLLLDAGADIDSQDASEATPLCIAIGAGHRAMVDLLRDRGAGENVGRNFRFFKSGDRWCSKGIHDPGRSRKPDTSRQ